MKAIRVVTFALCAGLSVLAFAQSAANKGSKPKSDRAKLIGAWHLESLGELGPDGKLSSMSGLKGELVYTADGHMSVQIMYPDSAANVSNDYVLNGFEASFGSYVLDEAKHIVTHHVQGSITHGLVGRDLRRVYQLTDDGRLIIKSVNPDEHWQVVWVHY
jgi:Lipocalin-like domain